MKQKNEAPAGIWLEHLADMDIPDNALCVLVVTADEEGSTMSEKSRRVTMGIRIAAPETMPMEQIEAAAKRFVREVYEATLGAKEQQ